MNSPSHRFSVAPMMDWTDRHCRYFHRLLTRHALLYTEMVTAAAILHGDRARLLGFDAAEHPVAVQLGGSDPEELADAAAIAAEFGYGEVNLNVGCPSDRVQSGRFGACLMAEPELVADCVRAMKAAVAVPVTVKCRLGIDDQDTGAPLDRFVAAQIAAGVDGLVVHARKAWLKGLSPKENRDIPPLDYDRVHRLKRDFPDVPMALNGGLESVPEAVAHLETLDGIMFGRAAYQRPGLLREVDRLVFADPAPQITDEALIAEMHAYAVRETAQGVPLHHVTRPMIGLFHGAAGARVWRRMLTVDAQRPGARPDLLLDAYQTLVRAGRRDAA
ncbi:tRNA dihydrouridine(20/20a) synthase DusA [Microbaculum marinisediminis]|uniref:tRNA-dihydrouridine(20/20a) synthase n=1 Tax=Microbaculum marinisediminis TaxID=2931392 RepID=A0AAW5QT28_9HYPH|nr:tRNA dihydrouridine(20/20a) synthase DusA [Microbaculum sp. A6E488]MCT8971115.1 tRNA dihydrouridine(20/20a) synthase DusA [Microbaculum sp. A6E488]